MAKKLTAQVEAADPIFAEQYKRNIENPTTRLLVQIVITGAMKDYYFATGESCSSKFGIVKKIKENVPNYQFIDLLDYCVKWRRHPEIITPKIESFMKVQYQLWRTVKIGKPVDFVPLSTT